MPSGSEEQTLLHTLLGRFELAIEMKVSEMNILELYLRIRQFAAHPNIYVDAMRRKFGSAYTRGPWMGTASKMEAFRNFLVARPPEPTIVFTSFKGEIEVAESHLRTAGYETWCIRGGMTENQRSRVMTESAALAAEAGAKPVAILIQIVAGGAGLNLQHCSRVCFLSSHWNPAVVDQAIARAYRMGQSKQVKVVHFLIAELAANNIDRLMAERHGIKRTIATEIHPKLYCDSAVSIDQVSSSLDSAVEHVVSVEAGSD
jgi:SNF2 family DNA or RNA helicase